MNVVSNPAEFPDDKYHTVTIETEDHRGFHIAASSNDSICFGEVESIGVAGESVGVESGYVTLGSADSYMRLEYVDLTDEYGYDEMRITFEEKA